MNILIKLMNIFLPINEYSYQINEYFLTTSSQKKKKIYLLIYCMYIYRIKKKKKKFFFFLSFLPFPSKKIFIYKKKFFQFINLYKHQMVKSMPKTLKNQNIFS
jgi:hypothetical protein